MKAALLVFLFLLAASPADKSTPIKVKIAATEILLPLPADMMEMPKDDPLFREATSTTLQPDSDIYSLGMVSRSVACVSYMTAQYVNVTREGKTERLKCVSVVGYIRLRQKVILVVTSLNKNQILSDELHVLKHTAERYQLALQTLNN